jgi:hypothetical protein
MNAIRISAIAALTCRDAMRSRLLLSLTAILVFGLLALPQLIEGDGTLPDRIQITIRYALGFAGFILSLATLWAACGAAALEIEDRRFYLIVTKPVHRYEIWIGKWLAIILLDAGLLAVVGLMVSGLLTWTLRTQPADSPSRRQAFNQWLQAREPVTALNPLPDFDARVDQEVQRLIASNLAQPDAQPADLEADVRRQMMRSAFSLPPDGSLTLVFPLPPDRLENCDLSLFFKVLSSQPGYRPTVVQWTFGEGMHQVNRSMTNYAGRRWKQDVPAIAVSGNRKLTLTLRHDANSREPVTLILAPDGQPPELLVPVGSFGPNLTRALLIILCQLAFLAALGTSAGCLLSMPVAVFLSFFVMVLLASAGYLETVSSLGAYYVPHEGPSLEQTRLDRFVIGMLSACNTITAPLRQLDPIPLLSEGRVVSWHRVARALALVAGLYTGLAAAVGMTLFRRRELG